MTNTQKERTSAPVSGGNTDMQLAFIDHLVTGNMNPTEAARQAGYAQPKQAAYRLTRAPHIQAAIRQARQTIYSGELTNMAIGTLKTVMTDPDAPASSKVSAARTVFELAGDLGKLSGGRADRTAGRDVAGAAGAADRPKGKLTRKGAALKRWRCNLRKA